MDRIFRDVTCTAARVRSFVQEGFPRGLQTGRATAVGARALSDSRLRVVLRASTGTFAFDFKGAIGTSSRKLPAKLGGYTIGVLVQTNFGGILTIAAAPVGQELGHYFLKQELGSIMIVIATDAPVDARNLKRMGARAMMGLARTGAAGTNGSGDYAIAFSTARNATALVPDDAMSPLFLATIEATEEAIDNSLFMATSVKDVEALPIDRTIEILKKYNALADRR